MRGILYRSFFKIFSLSLLSVMARITTSLEAMR